MPTTNVSPSSEVTQWATSSPSAPPPRESQKRTASGSYSIDLAEVLGKKATGAHSISSNPGRLSLDEPIAATSKKTRTAADFDALAARRAATTDLTALNFSLPTISLARLQQIAKLNFGLIVLAGVISLLTGIQTLSLEGSFRYSVTPKDAPDVKIHVTVGRKPRADDVPLKSSDIELEPQGKGMTYKIHSHYFRYGRPGAVRVGIEAGPMVANSTLIPLERNTTQLPELILAAPTGSRAAPK